MDKPKKQYRLSQARRLGNRPCPDYGHLGQIRYEKPTGLGDEFNPEVPVGWDCNNIHCSGPGYFWIESE